MIEFSGTVTVADYASLFYFHMRGNWWRLLLIFSLLSIAVYFGTEGTDGRLWTWILTAVFFLLIVAWNPYRVSKKLMKGWVKGEKPLSIKFDEAGIHAQDPRMSATFQWSSVVRVFETRSMVVIYTSELAALRLPKRFFVSPEQRADWESMMEAKLGPNWRKSPGWLAPFF